MFKTVTAWIGFVALIALEPLPARCLRVAARGVRADGFLL